MLNQWDNTLPLEPTHITPNIIAANLSRDIDIIIAGLPTLLPTKKQGHPITNPHERAIKHIIQLTHSLYTTQTNNVGYILINTPCTKLHPHTRDWLGPINTLNGPPCGSGASRITRCCQNIAINSSTQTKFNNLPTPTLTINTRLEQANFLHWRAQPATLQHSKQKTNQTPPPLPPNIAIHTIIGHLNSPAFRMHKGLPGNGLFYHKNTLREPNASIKELLMGFQPGTTEAPGLSEADRCQILGQTPDLNILTWLITQATHTTQLHKPSPQNTLTQPSTTENNLPTLPRHYNTTHTRTNTTPPQPIPWHPLHNPEEWTYTDGSYKDGKPRLGASVIHSPTNTTTCIDASGQD